MCVCVCVCVCFFGRVGPEVWSKSKPKGWFEKGCVVGCGFHVVVTVCPNGGKNPNKSDENPSKISPKSMKIWSRGVSGPFWAQVAPRSVQGRSPYFGVLDFWSSFGGKGSPKGIFLEIPKIGNGTKIDQLRQDRRLDPLKMLFLEGSDKYMKNPRKTNQKRRGFGREKHAKTM